MSVKLVEKASDFLAKRTSRRGFIQKTAFVGSALTVNPLQYVLRPGSAYAAICNCSGSSCDCGAGCCDGYTEFCCTITGNNSCPPGTLMAGWWKADGSGFCDVNGQSMPRYYMDCNADCHGCGCGGSGVCGQECTDCACTCANGSCGNRKSCCTSFRYGQCNQHVQCVGQIVCRVVTCTPPWEIDPSCTRSVATDNNTRFHDAACLHQPEHVPMHPEGALVSTAGASPWLIVGSQRWPFITNDAFESHANPADVAVVTSAILERYAVVGAGYRDGVVLRTPDHRVWLVSNGVRRHITSGAHMASLGINPAAMRNVSDAAANVNREWFPFSDGERLPEGMFVRNRLTGQIFRVVGATLRPIPTPRILASYQVRPEEVATPSDQMLATTPVGPGLGFRDGSLILTPDGRVWAISLGQRRHILSPAAFDALGYQPASVMMVSEGEAALHPVGEPLDGSRHPDGALVRAASGPTVWLVLQGRRHLIQHPDALSSRAAEGEVAVAADARLAPLPVHVWGWRDGVLLRTPDGKVWLVTEGQRRHITDQSALDALGYTSAAFRYVPAEAAAVHPEGEPISSDTALLEGMFVRPYDSSIVYRIDNNEARPLAAPEALASWHVGDAEIASVDPSKLPVEGDVLGFRDGTLIRTPEGAIWVISNGERRHIASPEVMTSLGYASVEVMSTSHEVAAVHPVGPALS